MGKKFVLSQEDGTVDGGNARGDGAVDLQTVRTLNSYVASGNNSVIVGGQSNIVTGANSVVVGGTINSSAGFTAFVGGGNQNYAQNSYSVAVGGAGNFSNGSSSFVGAGVANNCAGDGSVITGGYSNTTSAGFGTISGGQSNTVSSNTHATVIGGHINTASGSAAIAGGSNNTASGQYAIALGYNNNVGGGESSIALGYSNIVTGYRTLAIGTSNNVAGTSSAALGRSNSVGGTYAFAVGFNNVAGADYSCAFGGTATTFMYGGMVNANGRFQYNGDAQFVKLLARREASLTSGAIAKLSLDGTGVTNLINFGFSSDNYISMLVTIQWSVGINNANGATGLTKGDCKTQTDQIMIKKVFAGPLLLIGGITTLVSKGDTSMSGCTMDYTVSSYGELILNIQAPTFISGGPITLRTLANIEAVSLTVAPY